MKVGCDGSRARFGQFLDKSRFVTALIVAPPQHPGPATESGTARMEWTPDQADHLDHLFGQERFDDATLRRHPVAETTIWLVFQTFTGDRDGQCLARRLRQRAQHRWSR